MPQVHNLDVDGDGKPTVEDMLVTFRLCNVAGANAAGEAPQRSPSAHIIRTDNPHTIRTYNPHISYACSELRDRARLLVNLSHTHTHLYKYMYI